MTFNIRLLTIPCLALAALQFAQAADVEVFGGYAVTRMRPENDSNQTTMNGWNTTVTAYATKRFGVTADFAGFYGIAPTGLTNGADVNIRQYSFMGGPQVRLFHAGRVSSSVRAVFGAAYGYVPDSAYDIAGQTKFSTLVGSNLDIRVTRRVSMRFSPGLYVTTFGYDQTQKNLRFSVGPVFHFGGDEN
jgi:maltoporin